MTKESASLPFEPRAPVGTRDVLFPESAIWTQVISAFYRRASLAGYGLVLNPLFEDARVFSRSMGEQAEVVRKEMYTFTDRGGRELALRPEGTASVVRAFVQHRPGVPWKAWYLTPAFRYERPQAGRYRQHHQLGVEVIGSDDPDLDAEVIALASRFYEDMGLEALELRLNSMGDPNCAPKYKADLATFLSTRTGQLCTEHAQRASISPLRVLDCKTDQCRQATADAPRLVDWLCAQCSAHLDRVLSGLDSLGVPYSMDYRLVRGFDYYTRTTFEFASSALEGAQNGVGGGGRYDGLVHELGGPHTPGIGFGIGIERLLLALKAEGRLAEPKCAPKVFVIDLTGGRQALEITQELWDSGVSANRSYGGRSLKAQLRAADRSGASVAAIVGTQELEERTVSLRMLRVPGSDQLQVPRSELAAFLAGLDQDEEFPLESGTVSR
ncbi:MAG: histidine--tRNA ligase [Actinobacteria bacterium]|nr:histidine--tRNA ligase [Actinomycetota bacterium]